MIASRRLRRYLKKNKRYANAFAHPSSKVFIITDIRRVKSLASFQQQPVEADDQGSETSEVDDLRISLSSSADSASSDSPLTPVEATCLSPLHSASSKPLDFGSESGTDPELPSLTPSFDNILHLDEEELSVTMVAVPVSQAAGPAGPSARASQAATGASNPRQQSSGPFNHRRQSSGTIPRFQQPPNGHPDQRPPGFAHSASHPMANYYASMVPQPNFGNMPMPPLPFGSPEFSPMAAYGPHFLPNASFTPPMGVPQYPSPTSTPPIQQTPSPYRPIANFPRRAFGGPAPMQRSPSESPFASPRSQAVARAGLRPPSPSPVRNTFSLPSPISRLGSPAAPAKASPPTAKPTLRPDVKSFEPTSVKLERIVSPQGVAVKDADEGKSTQPPPAETPSELACGATAVSRTHSDEDSVLRLPLWIADDAESDERDDTSPMIQNRASMPASRDPWASTVSPKVFCRYRKLTLCSRTISGRNRPTELGTRSARLWAAQVV